MTKNAKITAIIINPTPFICKWSLDDNVYFSVRLGAAYMYELFAFFDLDQIDSNTLKRCISFLPAERKDKALRYRHEIDRKTSVVSYLLLVHALYQLYGLRTPHIAYTHTEKPYLTEHPDIHFNISHCPQGCVCAISDKPIGVDIQDIRPFSWDVARRCCSMTELRLLKQSSDPTSFFTRMWAMKESYLKMTGEGITQSLSAIDTTGVYSAIHTTFVNNCYIAVSNVQFFQEESK